ncbi:hypothetical protein FDI29_gp49 [Arthrobacter phage Abidatro]|uniref:Uncharacterized protein n=1 Tax=Arthrobacter phage Abidatro TaxID=2015853 RepID=A0A222ZFW4_9CAUD|nr:hypothetical protein FDI29_gp49 [Arthrobacter phage Abidatro]ASR83219.1 hypothetical protein SEA_ABIDATRO_49 [Arthrobacter phage Abidatro]
MSIWTMVSEGFALGPVREITERGRTLTLRTIWTDEDGVCVEIDTGDEPVPASMLPAMTEAAGVLAFTPAPTSAEP